MEPFWTVPGVSIKCKHIVPSVCYWYLRNGTRTNPHAPSYPRTLCVSLTYISRISNEIMLLNLHILYGRNLKLIKFVTSLEKLKRFQCDLFRMLRFVPFHSVPENTNSPLVDIVSVIKVTIYIDNVHHQVMKNASLRMVTWILSEVLRPLSQVCFMEFLGYSLFFLYMFRFYANY